MTDVLATYLIVIFRLKVSCITSVDGTVTYLIGQLSRDVIGRLSVGAVMLLAMKSCYVVGVFGYVYCQSLTVVYC